MAAVRRALSNGTAAALSSCLSKSPGAPSAKLPNRCRSPLAEIRTGRHSNKIFATQAATSSTPLVREEIITDDPMNNVTDNIFSKIGINLHQKPGHPLCTIKTAIHDYFTQVTPPPPKQTPEDLPLAGLRSVSDVR